jgi:hypothetical protein
MATYKELDADVKKILHEDVVFPAHPLALTEQRKLVFGFYLQPAVGDRLLN